MSGRSWPDAAVRAAGGAAGLRTAPCARSRSSSRTVDPRALFYGNNVLWKTLDGGINWTQISPDLTRETWDVPKSVGTYASRVQTRERGAIGAQVIYTIGPSYRDINRIWIGTDDGVIETTADGGLHWTNVTPPQMSAFMKVFTIDPGRFDPLTAYAAVNTLRLDDMNPHIYRTHDGGKTWKEIVNGIPGGAPVSVVREDPKRKGLLFAGSETQVYVSFDDGDHWQSLRLNMAASSVRDLVVKDDDLVVGTHGRGIWILDDITPLRQIERGDGGAGGGALQAAGCVARAVEHEHRHAAAARRADGAEPARGRDHQLLPASPRRRGRSRSRSSAPTASWCAATRAPTRCSSPIRRRLPSRSTGSATSRRSRPRRGCIASRGTCTTSRSTPLTPGSRRASAGRTCRSRRSPATPCRRRRRRGSNPGTFTVKLTVNGKAYTQPIVVKQDPRVKTPLLAMQQIYSAVEGARTTERSTLGRRRAQVRKRCGPARQAAAAGDGRRGRVARDARGSHRRARARS